MTYWVCRYCVLSRGVVGSELKDWPAIEDHEAQARHVERAHHIPVRREGETEQQAMSRFRSENPEAGGPSCRCPKCAARRAATS